MNARVGEWRSRLLLASLSTLLVLAFAEVAARALLRSRPPGVVEGTPISEVSSTLGWRTRPKGVQHIRRQEFEITIAINSRGLRGPEIPYESDKGARRLAIMGDSFAHGYYANEPETLRGRLAEALGPCRIDVLNAGAPGYSTDQEWLYFDEEVQKYHPGEVVLLFYYNDLHFNLESVGTANRAKPRFLEKDGSLELVPPAKSATPAVDREARAGARRAALYHHSALWAFAAERLQRSRPDWSRALSDYGLTPELSREPPGEYLPFGPRDTRERSRVEEMWMRTSQILGRFRDAVRQGGAGFSVFYVPARFEANDEAWAFVRRRYETDRPWNRDSVRTRLGGVLAQLDIPLIETEDAFRNAERTENHAYLALDGHWNARGNQIAFDGLFPAMRRAFSCGS